MKWTRIIPLLALLFLTGCQQNTATGSLFVRSSPEGAVVELNGQVLGSTPLQRPNIPAGTHLLKVRRDGYSSETYTIHVTQGQQTVQEVNLRPLRGLVLIESNPPGAAVTINDVFEGNTPLPMHNIRFGDHKARLVLAGYKDRDIEFEIEDRIPKSVAVDMISTSGSLQIFSDPPGAKVFVDGRDEGVTPLSIPRVQEGERDVRLQMAGFEAYANRITVIPSEAARIDATLSPLPGGLSVVSVPDGARIYVNGEYRGDSPLNLAELSPGVYTLRASLRGHADVNSTVEVARGQNKVEELQMERNSGILQIVTRPAGVKVNINGEFMGTTKAASGSTDVVSLPLQIDLLSQGSHTLQLVKQGYSFENKRFFITKDEVTTLDESLERLFIPNTLVRTGDGQDDVVIGVLIRRHLNGDIELEVSKGIFQTVPRAEVKSVEPLKQEEQID